MIRNTVQRTKILEHLKIHRTHPTAQEIYDKVKDDLPHISLGTVYRNLDNLCKEGLIRAVHIAGDSRYEALDIGVHDHFVCKSCNKIMDLEQDRLSDKAMDLFKKKYPRIQAQDVIINWSGICQDCGGKNGRKSM